MATEYDTKWKIPLDNDKFLRQRWVQDQFNRYEQYYVDEIQRMIHNQQMYWGINFGQWPAYAVQRLISQGRRPPTYNIIAKKIESQIGSFISNGFDIKYETRNGQQSQWALHLQDMMYSDRSNCGWQTSETIGLRDMFCMVGYERMYISDRFDADFGNIAWEACPPSHIYIDPSWKSYLAFDIDNYFEYSFLTMAQIIDLYPRAADRLREQYRMELLNGVNYGDYDAGPQRYRTVEEKWGDWHRVITYHSINKETRKWEYDLVNRHAFPETGYKAGSDEDHAIKAEYIRRMGLTPDDICMVNQTHRVKRIEAFCPTLHCEEFLLAGKDKIQTNNCNIYPLGNNFYGQFRGVVDDLEDVQTEFNKNKMSIQDMMSRTAKGSFILDRALAGGDEKKRHEIEDQWNNPAARIWVDEGSTAELGPHGGVVELKSHPPTSEMFQESQVTLSLADWLSTTPAAMDSRSEKSGESGKMMQTKIQAGLISQKYAMQILQRHKEEKAAAYPLQAKITYAGYPREFNRTGRTDPLIINQPARDYNGNRVVINDISVLPEMTVVLTPSQTGINVRTELRAQYVDTLKVLKDPSEELLKLIMIKNVYMTQDMSDEDRGEVRRACELLITIAAMKAAGEYLQLKQQMAQLSAPQQPPSGEGAPANVTQGKFDEKQAQAGTPQQKQLVAA
jgi:hypothetical protein